MPATEAMLERSAELKRALADFARDQRFEDDLNEWLDERLSGLTVQRQEDTIDALDTFILNHHLPDGRSLLECFVDEHTELSPADREMVRGWQDSVEGIFEVHRRDEDTLVVHNLVDDLDYRLRTNAGPRVLDRMRRGSFLICRIVPITDEWLMSGVQTALPRQDRELVYAAALDLAEHEPRLVFRNPELLKKAWELQREQREAFVAFFGSDCAVMPGSELATQMGQFLVYQQTLGRGADNFTAAERAQRGRRTTPETIKPELPEELTSVASVALLCDEVDGMVFLPNFALLEEAFAKPELIVDRRHREIVENYLEEPSFSPRVFERLAARDPARASRLFRRLLNQPDFDWQRDGEALLRRVKPSYYAEPVLPTVVPVNETLSRVAAQAPPEPARPAPRRVPRRKAQKKQRRR